MDEERLKKSLEGHNALQLARADAIDTYSNLEQQLCLLFADLMNTDFEHAALVFYRITNTHSRNRILESLIERKHNDKYRKFWNSVFKLVRQLDQVRNEIIHWHLWSVERELDDGSVEDTTVLAPHGDSDASIDADDIKEFIQKTEHVRLQVMMFYIHHRGDLAPENPQSQPSYEIFLRPITYPPQGEGFHLSRTPLVPEDPPQSSEG